MSHKDFPPRWNHVLVPTKSRAACLTGLSMYSPCSRAGELAQTVTWAAVSLLGPRAIPGPEVTWNHPFSEDGWNGLVDVLQSEIGEWEAVAVYERREGRTGMMALLFIGVDGRQAMCKMSAAPFDSIEREADALDLVAAAAPKTFIAPKVLARGAVDDWRYVLQSPLPLGRHRMYRTVPNPAILAEVRDAIAPIEKPDGTPASWVPSHGDFTPWNLRRGTAPIPILFDWETAGWAPDGSDQVLYLASAAAVGRPISESVMPEGEPALYWYRQVEERIATAKARGVEVSDLNTNLIRILAGPAGVDRT